MIGHEKVKNLKNTLQFLFFTADDLTLSIIPGLNCVDGITITCIRYASQEAGSFFFPAFLLGSYFVA